MSDLPENEFDVGNSQYDAATRKFENHLNQVEAYHNGPHIGEQGADDVYNKNNDADGDDS